MSDDMDTRIKILEVKIETIFAMLSFLKELKNGSFIQDGKRFKTIEIINEMQDEDTRNLILSHDKG